MQINNSLSRLPETSSDLGFGNALEAAQSQNMFSGRRSHTRAALPPVNKNSIQPIAPQITISSNVHLAMSPIHPVPAPTTSEHSLFSAPSSHIKVGTGTTNSSTNSNPDADQGRGSYETTGVLKPPPRPKPSNHFYNER